MTRDIFDINNFIVLIEHSTADKEEVEACGFDDKVIGLAFYGSGDVKMKMTCGGKVLDFHNTKGMALSFYGDRGTMFEHTISPEAPLQDICIVTSMKNFRKLPSQEQEIFEQYLDSLVNAKQELVAGPHFFMTPEMLAAVDKIFSTTYTGAMRKMFLRSQVTELLSHFFAQLELGAEKRMDESERDKLFQAHDILIENMAAPPSLNELSRMIGLNSNKLKKNFKELFGFPLFTFLQHQRLAKAHDMLKEENISIQEAAWGVGYESLSSFSNAFTKKFGFRPSEISQ